MNKSIEANELFIKKLSLLNSLDEKEKYLHRVISAYVFANEELTQIKHNPEIDRHLSLVHIIERHQEHNEFKESDKLARKESSLKILMGIPYPIPF